MHAERMVEENQKEKEAEEFLTVAEFEKAEAVMDNRTAGEDEK